MVTSLFISIPVLFGVFNSTVPAWPDLYHVVHCLKLRKKNSVGESDTQLNLNHYLLKTRLYNKAFLIEISQIGLLITLNQHSPPQAATPIKNSLFLPVWLTQQSVNGVWTRRRLRKIWHFWIFSCSKEVLIAKKTLIGFSTQLTVN